MAYYTNIYFQMNLAAKEIVRKEISEEDWDIICNRYGFDIDKLTDDEYDELERLVRNYGLY